MLAIFSMRRLWPLRFWDLVCAYRKYDPATRSLIEIALLYPGVRAFVIHSLAHLLYDLGVPFFPRFLSEVNRFVSGIDIHPGAKIGDRVLMDHAMGIVIGETAEIEDDVLIYQGVTLGGTSLEPIKRHPTIRKRCVLGAGSKILGNVDVGAGSRIGANSVVIRDVPAGSTVVGVPGKIVAAGGIKLGAELSHNELPDPISSRLAELEKRLEKLEGGRG